MSIPFDYYALTTTLYSPTYLAGLYFVAFRTNRYTHNLYKHYYSDSKSYLEKASLAKLCKALSSISTVQKHTIKYTFYTVKTLCLA